MSVEMAALVFPVALITAMLLVGVWQISVARLDLHTAAAAAARAASLAESATAAEAAASQTAGTALADAGRSCTNLIVNVDTTNFTHGGHVEVQLTCHATTGDLTGLNAPGTVAVTATARVPLEHHRQLGL